VASKFNAAKCKVMQVGHKQELSVVEEEKDLGVFTTNKLKSDRQCASAKAMSVMELSG